MIIPLDKSTDITPLRYNDKCDKYDYLTAVGCGTLAGIIDIFAVGSPNDSALFFSEQYNERYRTVC